MYDRALLTDFKKLIKTIDGNRIKKAFILYSKSEGLDQPTHQHSPIRTFYVRQYIYTVSLIPLASNEDPDPTVECAVCIGLSLSVNVKVLFFFRLCAPIVGVTLINYE